MNAIAIHKLPYARHGAVEYFKRLSHLPWFVWLDSNNGGRYDLLSALPHTQMTTDKPDPDPFTLLAHRMRKLYGQAEAYDWPDCPIPGMMGCFSYELGNRLEHIPPRADDIAFPLLTVGLYTWHIVLDHMKQTASLVYFTQYHDAASLLTLLEQPEKPSGPYQVQGDFESNFTRETYRAAFQQIHDYLMAGDCYQVNLAQRFSAQAQGDMRTAYLHLRQASQSPFSAYCNYPCGTIMSLSPEHFLSLDRNKTVITRPIKGTIDRASNPSQDQLQAQTLLNSRKNQAENIMIVDLLRNDLGKSCLAGSIRANKLFELESYPSVHHLVSTIQGILKPEMHAVDLLRDCFPGGSITGAPKHRAMQIIQSLEPHNRHIYCGSLAYIGPDNTLLSNIAIRTLLWQNERLYCWAGGGIVADSDWQREYKETFWKVGNLLGRLTSKERQ